MTRIIGRVDSMVKIRGYSVYLGAIEETLRKHCGVADAVVSAETEDGANKRLVAYVVREPGTTWRVDARSGTSRDLRTLLERYLAILHGAQPLFRTGSASLKPTDGQIGPQKPCRH